MDSEQTIRDRKQRLQWMKRCLAVLNAGRQVQISWAGRYLTREQWREEIINDLNQEMQAKLGGVPQSLGTTRGTARGERNRVRRPWRNWNHDQHYRFYRDQQALHARLQSNVIVRRFETAVVQRRYGHLLWQDEACCCGESCCRPRR